MKKLLASLLLLPSLLWAGTTTTRASLYMPSIHETGWSTLVNNNFDAIGSSACFQGIANTFTKDNAFVGGSFSLGDGSTAFGNLSIYPLSGTAAHIINQGSGSSPSLLINASGGTYFNGSLTSPAIPADIIAGGAGATNYGRFAVVGSSADASSAYSGFTATSPISASTLWSLPRADGTNGQLLSTDGSAHLSFTNASGSFIQNTSSLQSGATFYVSSGTILGTLRMRSNDVAYSAITIDKHNNLATDHSDVLFSQDGIALSTISYVLYGNGVGGAGPGFNSPLRFTNVHGIMDMNSDGSSSIGGENMLSTWTIVGNSSIGSTPVSPPKDGLYIQGGVVAASNTVLSGATFYQNAPVVISSITFSKQSGGILGETDGGNAFLSVVGAVVSTATLDTVGNNCGSSAQFSDLVSTGVPAGDWDFTFTLTANRGTATQLQFTQVQSGISTTAGNSATGLTYGSNALIVDEGATGLTYASPTIPSWRIVTTAALTQVYGKFLCTYSGGLPFAYGRLSARRAH